MTGFKEPPAVEIDTEEADRFVGQANSMVQLRRAESHSALSQLDRARLALEKAASIDVVKEIRDQAEALRIYAKQARQSFEMQNHCAEIKIRAERKAGRMLLDQDKNKGAAAPAEERDDIPRLRDLGISHSQSSRWQSIAGIPEETFELNLDRIKDASQEITSARFMKLAAKLARQRAQVGSGPDIVKSVKEPPNQELQNQPSVNEFKEAVGLLHGLILHLRKCDWRSISREEVVFSLSFLLKLTERSSSQIAHEKRA